MLEVENLSFSYKNKKVLCNLNFSIRKGKFAAVIGPNGSGKTTLLNLLTGFMQPQEGKIYFDSRPINEYSINQLARKMAVVSQDVNFRFPFTCLEVVMMGRTPFKERMKVFGKKDLEIVYRCMEETNTLQYADAFITEVSGGERQRIVLAKALAQTPEVLFLDEAFSSMDICYCIKSLNMLRKLVTEQGMTVVSIMHDLNMADTFSDTVIALDEGRLIGWGRREEVMNPEFLNRLFKVKIEKVGSRGLVIVPQL